MSELKAVKGNIGRANGSQATTAVAETLSALCDGEAADLELRRLLRDLDGDTETRARWYRYQVTRAALHGEETFNDPDFAARVRAAVEEEPEHAVSRGGWKRAVSSFAVAASVTMAVVLGGQQLAVVTSERGVEGVRVAPLPVGVVNTVGAVP